jgi:hypothetical protein
MKEADETAEPPAPGAPPGPDTVLPGQIAESQTPLQTRFDGGELQEDDIDDVEFDLESVGSPARPDAPASAEAVADLERLLFTDFGANPTDAKFDEVALEALTLMGAEDDKGREAADPNFMRPELDRSGALPRIFTLNCNVLMPYVMV